MIKSVWIEVVFKLEFFVLLIIYFQKYLEFLIENITDVRWTQNMEGYWINDPQKADAVL